MVKCSVLECNTRSGVNFKVYSFAKHPKYREIWRQACLRSDKRVGIDKAGHICTKHFNDAQFKRDLVVELTGKSHKRYRGLKDAAFPDQNLPTAHSPPSTQAKSKS